MPVCEVVVNRKRDLKFYCYIMINTRTFSSSNSLRFQLLDLFPVATISLELYMSSTLKHSIVKSAVKFHLTLILL